MASFNKFNEIANPKKDAEGKLLQAFRLEVLMQDIAILFGASEKIGVTYLNKIYSETSAKNNLNSGIEKQKQN